MRAMPLSPATIPNVIAPRGAAPVTSTPDDQKTEPIWAAEVCTPWTPPRNRPLVSLR